MGQALVEFALVIPVFLMILFGILDFGFALFTRLTLINATREGAHAAVTQVDNAPGIPVIVEGAIRANSPTFVWGTCSVSGNTRTCGSVTITTTCVRTSGSCDFSGTVGTLIPGDSISVVASYAHPSFFARFLGTTVPMSSTVSMVVE